MKTFLLLIEICKFTVFAILLLSESTKLFWHVFFWNCKEMKQTKKYIYIIENFLTVPAVWTEWYSWSDCSASCGPGSSKRLRQCTFDNCSESEICIGPSEDVRTCNKGCCKGNGGWLYNCNHLYKLYVMSTKKPRPMTLLLCKLSVIFA